jgi:hypothetical protein
MKVTPDLIPHALFHTGAWLLPVERPYWYYFGKKRNSNTIRNKDFIKSVDGPLKELVEFLHGKGIRTTPSCSGHHISERDLKKIYEALEEDSHDIRNGGLDLSDIETGHSYLFRDKNYSLPWEKEDFLEKVETYQQKGVLGMHLENRKQIKGQLLALNQKGVTITQKGSLLFIFTDESQQAAIIETWNKITAEVKKILK